MTSKIHSVSESHSMAFEMRIRLDEGDAPPRGRGTSCSRGASEGGPRIWYDFGRADVVLTAVPGSAAV